MPYSTNFVLLETPTSFIVAFRGSESIMHDWVSGTVAAARVRAPLPKQTERVHHG